MLINGVTINNNSPFQQQYSAFRNLEPMSFDDLVKDLKGEVNRNAPPPQPLRLERAVENGREAAEARMAELNAERGRFASLIDQMKMYKEDQLLSSPGGDSVFVNDEGKAVNGGEEHSGFTDRVGKDLNDVKDNLVNMLQDATFGSKFHYKDQNGEIKEGQRVGLLKTIENFFKDLASGLSLGAYTPGSEEDPSGAAETLKHSLKKVFVDAVYNDVLVGIPRSVGYVAKDTALATLNLAETIPDATIGNIKAGETVTNKVFDDTQVAIEFLTNALPGGDGRGRVYALKLGQGIKGLPIIHNLTQPEKDEEEEDFRYVRNTPFRKTIETISSIMPFGAVM